MDPALPITPIPKCLLFIAGFSCKSLSGQNNSAGLYTNCLSDFTGSTGQTYRGVLAHLRTHRPPLCLLENVKQLKQQEQTLRADMRAIGYNVVLIAIDPDDMNEGCRRERIWCLCADAAFLPEALGV